MAVNKPAATRVPPSARSSVHKTEAYPALEYQRTSV
jgi:hypothetical protein